MKAHLLLIEDDDDIALYMIETLQPYFVIEHVIQGEDAIRKLQNKYYQMVLSDQLLPGQFTGDEILRRARQLSPESHLFLLTGIHIDEYTADILQQENIHLIRKPISDYDQLVKRLCNHAKVAS